MTTVIVYDSYSWEYSLPFTVDANDLLQTNLATTVVFGTWSPFGSSTADPRTVLTDGAFYPQPNAVAVWTSGAAIEYDLDTSVNAFGYDVNSIETYGGWVDDYRDRMDYTIYYSVAGSEDWILFASVSHEPPAPYTWSHIVFPADLHNVTKVKFVAGNVETGGVSLGEIDVIGTPSTAIVEPVAEQHVIEWTFDNNLEGWSLVSGAADASLVWQDNGGKGEMLLTYQDNGDSSIDEVKLQVEGLSIDPTQYHYLRIKYRCNGFPQDFLTTFYLGWIGYDIGISLNTLDSVSDGMVVDQVVQIYPGWKLTDSFGWSKDWRTCGPVSTVNLVLPDWRTPGRTNPAIWNGAAIAIDSIALYDLNPLDPAKTCWAERPTEAMDFNQDCIVNLLDFAQLAEAWLSDTSVYSDGLLGFAEEWLWDTYVHSYSVKSFKAIYAVEDDAIVSHNGARFFNRPLYAPNIPAMTFAGDKPQVRFIDSEYCYGTLLLGYARGESSKWLHEFDTITTRFYPARVVWEISDSSLDGVRIRCEAAALAMGNGMTMKLSVEGEQAGDEVIWAFGGATPKRLEPGLPTLIWELDPSTSTQLDLKGAHAGTLLW